MRGDGDCEQTAASKPPGKHLNSHLVSLMLGEAKGREPRCPWDPHLRTKGGAASKSTPAAAEGNRWICKRPFDYFFYHLSH